MIQDGFTYIAVLVFVTGLLVCLPKLIKGNVAQKFFSYAPPVVLIYLVLMLLCTLKLWDLDATYEAYGTLKNPVLYAMLFIMLLRCDLRKIIKLGPKMLIGFFSATFSIALGFVIAYTIMHSFLDDESWKAIGALCGSWMGGTGNMLAIQSALNVPEDKMAYTLVMDSICATIYVIFLLWVIGFSKKFNKWTKSDTQIIDEIGRDLEAEEINNAKHLPWQNILIILGVGLLVSTLSQYIGEYISKLLPAFDKSTWTVLVVTLFAIVLAMTSFGKIKGTEEISNVLLYIVIALIASRANLSNIGNAPAWLLTGFLVLLIHVIAMVIFAKIFRLDIFTCSVASLANVGGTATAPVLAGSYNSSLVPVGIVMALLGYIVGTGGGLIVANILSMIS